uniref:ARAD1D24002p n=1 Tax=Blastobotrys adeninivorans TaxID=409370 RepID=A0A060TFK6_BLAAD
MPDMNLHQNKFLVLNGETRWSWSPVLTIPVDCDDFERRLLYHLHSTFPKTPYSEPQGHVVVNGVTDLARLDKVYTILEHKVPHPTKLCRILYNTGTAEVDVRTRAVSRLRQSLIFEADKMLAVAVHKSLDHIAMLGYRVDSSFPVYSRYCEELVPLREFADIDGNLAIIDRTPDRAWVRDSLGSVEPAVVLECRIGQERHELDKLCDDYIEGYAFVNLAIVFNVHVDYNDNKGRRLKVEVVYKMRDDEDVCKSFLVSSTGCTGRIFFPFDWLCDRRPGEDFPDNTQIALDGEVLCELVRALEKSHWRAQDSEVSIDPEAFQALRLVA